MTIIFDEDKANKKFDEVQGGEEEDLAQILSQRYGLPYIDLSQTSINSDALRLIPEEDARTARLAIFDMNGKKLRIAILSPQKAEATSILSLIHI